jgi:outer membrane protein assembly factor BamE
VQFDFTTTYSKIHDFCASDLSALYLDIRKDCLYCDPKDSLNRKWIAALLAGVMMSATTGCVYRIDVPQGNYVEQKQVNQLRIGMTRAQVEYVMGSPMVTDQNDPNVWYYIYYLKPGWDKAERKDLHVMFKNDRLAAISGDFHTPSDFYRPL